MQRAKLQASKQICALIQRSISSPKRAPHLSSCIVDLVADPLDQKVYALLRCHLFQMKAEREDDPRRAMHAPEEHANPVLRRFGEVHIPQQHLPVERAALAPERRGEKRTICSITRGHEALQMMPRYQLVKDRRAREMDV